MPRGWSLTFRRVTNTNNIKQFLKAKEMLG